MRNTINCTSAHFNTSLFNDYCSWKAAVPAALKKGTILAVDPDRGGVGKRIPLGTATSFL